MATDLKVVMQEKGEMIALGAAIAILVGYAAWAYGVSSDTDLKTLRDQVTAAKGKLQSNPPPKLERSDFTPITAAWGEGAVAKPEGAREFVAMFKAEVKPKIKSGGVVKPPVDVPKTLLAPVMSAAETELGQVTVKWAEGKKAGAKMATISEYELHRQESGKGWEKLATVPGTKRSYVDQSVQPKKKYAYRVMARTKETTTDGKKETEFSTTVEATIPSGVVIIYTGGSPQAAQIRVRKFLGGEWKEKSYTVIPKNEELERPGNIGKIEKEKNPETNKFEEVDYRTNYVLLEIKTDKYKFKRTVRENKIVDGQLVTEEKQVDAERDRMKILFLDDEGKQREMWISDEKEEEEGGSE
jgi:hypothetical protein